MATHTVLVMTENQHTSSQHRGRSWRLQLSKGDDKASRTLPYNTIHNTVVQPHDIFLVRYIAVRIVYLWHSRWIAYKR